MRASIEEYNKVEEVIRKYTECVHEGKTEELKKIVFRPEACCYGYLDGEFIGKPIQILYDNIEKLGSDPKFISRIEILHIEGTVAIARVLEENWFGNKFTDFMSLIKFGNEWKIVAKVFNTF